MLQITSFAIESEILTTASVATITWMNVMPLAGLALKLNVVSLLARYVVFIACAPDTYRAIVGHVSVAARVEASITHSYMRRIGR